MTWPDATVAVALLSFISVLLIFLLKEKRIDSENTVRFACIGVGVLIIVIVAFVPMSNDKAVSALTALAGTVFGYIIRDATKKG